MVKIEIKGGLGNQMFQYAYAKKLDIIDNKDIIFDLSFFEKEHGKSTTRRQYKLDNFNIPKIKTINKDKKTLLNRIYKKVIRKIGIEKEEYFQNESYFKEIDKVIRKEFTLKKPFSSNAKKILDEIANSNNSVSIHIRRGDYALDPNINQEHGTCSLKYYKEVIEYIKYNLESPNFFLFSDDIEWVNNNIKIDNSVCVSSYNIPDYEELIVMSNCNHNIIANSSFSWWGAWLNKNPSKTVIAPKQWTRNKTSDELDILPKDWIQF